MTTKEPNEIIQDPQLKVAMNGLQKTFDDFEKRKAYQLSFPWAETSRGIPNELVRSALFSGIRSEGQHADHLRDVVVFSQSGFTIRYTGYRLDQTHLDIFSEIMHIARGKPEGSKITFTGYELLKGMGRHKGKYEYDWLVKKLQDITATSVLIEKDGRRLFWTSLLPKGNVDLEKDLYTVEISKELCKLFDRGFTLIEWEQRAALRRKPLAQHLHLWILSHEKPIPVTIEYLKNLTGSQTKQAKHFKEKVKKALDEIKKVGTISEWIIDENDKVHIKRIA